MKDSIRNQPAFIVIGEAPGTGKTTLAKRLSSDLAIPRLGSNTLGRTIRHADGFSGGGIDAYRIGYTLLWRPCAEFLQSGVSVIVDTNMGWSNTWQSADSIRESQPDCTFLPIILRCSRETSLARIGERHVGNPSYYAPPEQFTRGDARKVWEFLDQLDRPEVRLVDASRPADDVYHDVWQHVTAITVNRTTV